MPNLLTKTWRTFKNFFKEMFDHDPMQIIPYVAYAHQNRICIKGRILEDEGFVLAEQSTLLDNLINNLKSFKSDVAKETPVIINYQGHIITCKTDKDGYFCTLFTTYISPILDNKQDKTYATIIAPAFVTAEEYCLHTKIKVLHLHPDTANIIVSDIDDTILVTHVNSFLKLKMIYLTLFKNERSRMPFEDIAQVLHALTLNKEGKAVNPIFYLSNSPWNLYNLLTNFLKFQHIPLGPLFLRDFGIKFGEKRKIFKNHKRDTLQHLFEFYAQEKFILLGDATENDTDIYLDMYFRYPHRVDYIFIRGNKSKIKHRILTKIQENPEVPIYLIEHSSDILRIKDKKEHA